MPKAPAPPPAATAQPNKIQPTTPAPATAPATAPGATPAAPPPGTLRIATLTPKIKLEMVRAVRDRIADESHWLPNKVNGENTYAAKLVNGEQILVGVMDKDATRFSLLGAFLLEFQRRHVVRTAPGRTKLLDQEIPDAIREVLLENMSEAERAETEDPMANPDRPLLGHAQCLAALNLLEEQFAQLVEQAETQKSKRKLGHTKLADLVKKLEQQAPIPAEDVATALFHELKEVRRRLDRLENQDLRKKPPGAP